MSASAVLQVGFAIALASVCVGCGAAPPTSEEREAEKNRNLKVELVKTLVDAGAYENAVPLLRAALARDPKEPRLHYLMGTILRERGRYAQAHAEYELALQYAPGMPASLAGNALVYDLEGEHAKAEPLHRQAIKGAPNIYRYHNNFGFSLYLQGRFEEAVKSYEEAIRLNPNASIAFINLGFALAAKGDDKPALQAFEQVLKPAEALNNLAIAHELRGKNESAGRLYGEALETDPGLKEALKNLEALAASKNHGKKESEP